MVCSFAATLMVRGLVVAAIRFLPWSWKTPGDVHKNGSSGAVGYISNRAAKKPLQNIAITAFFRSSL